MLDTPRCFSRPARSLLLGGVLLALAAAPAFALKVVDYNLLNYDNLASYRDPAFRTIFTSIGTADVLAVEEVQDQAAAQNFLNNVLNVVQPGQWALAPFFNDPDQSFNQGLFYRPAAVSVTLADTLGSAPRDIAYYTLLPTGYLSSAASITLFVVHLKAGATSSDQATRLEETTRLRAFMNTFPAGTNMAVLGDYNVRSSTETNYQRLVESQADNDGRVQDPINMPGTWYNNGSFAPIHTQSTRVTNDSPNDGGATGGMDDRFDQILPTYSLADGEGLDQLPSTYTAFGNDGLHFNLDINASPTIPEGQAVADALHRASDHLPVILEFQVPAKLDATIVPDYGTVIIDAFLAHDLTVSNGAVAPADELDYSLSAAGGFSVAPGPYQAEAGMPGNVHSITLDTSTAGQKVGNVIITSDDLDNPASVIGLTATVVRHGVPSLEYGSVVEEDSLDFGRYGEGQFPDRLVEVWNQGFDALQAKFEIYALAVVGGDNRFSVENGPTNPLVGGGVSQTLIAFDDAGAVADTTYEGTLYIYSHDDSSVQGAGDLLPDLIVTLLATTSSGVTGVGEEPEALATRLAPNQPNPFRADTMIRFEVAQAGQVDLSVFDVQGRRIRRLVDGWLDPGSYAWTWDGRTDDGRETGPGVYFYQLATTEGTKTMRMVRVR